MDLKDAVAQIPPACALITTMFVPKTPQDKVTPVVLKLAGMLQARRLGIPNEVVQVEEDLTSLNLDLDERNLLEWCFRRAGYVIYGTYFDEPYKYTIAVTW